MNGEDVECPRCKTTKYRDPQLVLFVNSCGHPLCEKCIEIMFAKGVAKCYQCPTPLKRANFKKQLFQDSGVERDVQIRKSILNKYNKGEDAFQSLRDYNDYLEKLETLIYNMSNNINEEESNALLEELKKPIAIKVEQQEAPYYHEIEQPDHEGPPLPELDYRFDKAIRSFSKRDMAGGFTAALAMRRALQEAFSSLFFR